jgi:hypothetical protein
MMEPLIIKTPGDVANLFKRMGYKFNFSPLDKTQFEFPQRASDLIEEFYIVSDYASFQIYFAKTKSMRRTDFRTIIEPFYRRYPQVNTLFVFTTDFSEIAFVSPHRIPYDSKVKILLRTLYLDPSSPYHTDLEVLEMLRISLNEQFPEIIWQKHKEAFNVERVTEEFFEAYKHALTFIRDEVLIPQRKADYSKCHSFAQQLLSRIMFLYYLQKKGWLKWKDYVPDKRYIKNLWEKYKKYRENKDTFYSLWLSSLFFSAFNKDKKHEYLKSQLPDEIKESFNLMPFLNGGLFTKNELDEIDFKIPDAVFELLFETDTQDKNKGFLERFNFTVREDTPLDVEVAVDPEMLGKVYESLIAEEERQKVGIFYTPRVEIDLMCRLSLVEYLFEETKIPKDDLISLVFEPQEIENYDNLENLRKIKSALDSVKIVDPCVGSASFLVGMMNVLVEIHSNLIRKIEKREENLFALKQKIILENLYGVDVKDWAVMVGELRLWLSLIIETDEKYMDIYTKPLLPNLSFKMRQGDSLIEEIAGQKIMLRKEFAILSPTLKAKVQELADRKALFFSGGRSADLREKEEIEKLENDIFKEIVEQKISEYKKEKEKINAQIKHLSSQQLGMFGTKAKEFKDEQRKLESELQQIENEISKLEKVKRELQRKTSKDYFLWEIDFAEVFYEKGGFDIVIGNPPYVRQELIAYPLDREDDFSPEEWKRRKSEYKEKLVESVNLLWDNVKIDRRSDLYVYFYYHGLSILRPGGIFCFINSNSWLDVGYGAGLQEFLLKNMKPIYIIDNLKFRSFEQDINTVIVLIKRPKDKNQIKDEDVLKFIAFKKPFEEIAKAEVFKQIEKEDKFVINDIYRLFPKKRLELLEEGVEITEDEGLILDVKSLPYIGNKWGGKYLRAPEIFFKILEKGKDKLVRLGDIAEVKFGIKTGANEFFYLEPTGKPAPKGLLHVKNSAGWEGYIEEEFLKPVIKSPRELKTILVREEDLKYKVFMCHKSKEQLKGTYALKYIEWGEKQGYHKRPTCASRPRWWDLGEQEISLCVYPMVNNDRLIVSHNDLFFGDANVVGIYPKEVHYRRKSFSVVLNFSVLMIFWELYGISNLGEGAIKQNPIYFKQFYVPDIKFFDGKKNERFSLVFEKISTREILSIFEELGFPKCTQRNCKHPEHPYEYVKPEEVSFDRIMPDRRELDKIVFGALGLTEEEQLEVYRAVLELVKNRLLKAKSK